MADSWEDRPDVMQAALEVRQSRKKPAGMSEPQRRLEGPKAANGHDEIEPLSTVCAALLAGKNKPRQFLDAERLIPLGDVFMLSGHGGVGKSLLAMQLLLACTTGTPWLGMDMAQGTALYFSCEDDLAEMTRRSNAIAEAEGFDLAQAFTLHFMARTMKTTLLAVEDKGRIVPTPLFARLERTLADFQPLVLAIDNLADVYGGNENNRMQVQQFATMLRGLAMRHDCTIILLAHPSLSGLTSGSGLSGNTQWHNSFRGRAYTHMPEGDGADPDVRIIEIMKGNYAEPGRRLQVKWNNNRFVRVEADNPWSRVTVADLEKVRVALRGGNHQVSDQGNMWAGYVVANILDLDAGEGLKGALLTPEQRNNRRDIKLYLARWAHERQLFIIKGERSAGGRRSPCYTSIEPKEDQDE